MYPTFLRRTLQAVTSMGTRGLLSGGHEGKRRAHTGQPAQVCCWLSVRRLRNQRFEAKSACSAQLVSADSYRYKSNFRAAPNNWGGLANSLQRQPRPVRRPLTARPQPPAPQSVPRVFNRQDPAPDSPASAPSNRALTSAASGAANAMLCWSVSGPWPGSMRPAAS